MELNNTNNNAAVAQSTVPKTDTVEVSPASVAFAATAKVEEVTPQIAMTKEESIKVVKADVKQSMKDNQEALKSLVKDLKESGMGRNEVKGAVKSANKAANKEISNEIKQAYKDFSNNKINESQLTDKLYGAAVKKLDSIVSALRDALAQKTGSAETKVDDAVTAAKANAEKSAEAARAAANQTSEKAEKVTPPGLAVKAEKEVEKAEKEEGDEKSKIVINTNKGNGNGIGNGTGIGEGILGSGPGSINANEKADNAFGQLVDFFSGIDKIINGFADKAEGKDNSEDKGDSLVRFASRLNDMFSGINKAFGRQSNGGDVGHRLGMTQAYKQTISRLFENGHGSGGGISRISDAGEGSGNLSVGSFMSSMSNGINDALNTYKEVQKKVEEQKAAKEEAKEAVGALV